MVYVITSYSIHYTKLYDKSSQQVLEALGPALPELLGGSADLAPSNLTQWSGSQSVSAGAVGGNYIHYGVREFGMSAIMNGVALHGGFIPYGGSYNFV